MHSRRSISSQRIQHWRAWRDKKRQISLAPRLKLPFSLYSPHPARCSEKKPIVSGWGRCSALPCQDSVTSGCSWFVAGRRPTIYPAETDCATRSVSAWWLTRTNLHWPRIGRLTRNQPFIDQYKGPFTLRFQNEWAYVFMLRFQWTVNSTLPYIVQVFLQVYSIEH